MNSKENEGDEILDALELNCRQMLSLLEDRQIGLLSWNLFLRDRINSLDTIISAMKKG